MSLKCCVFFLLAVRYQNCYNLYRNEYLKDFPMNTLSAAELKRRGMAAIEDGLRRGPVHIVKRNRSAAVVLSEDDYQRLAHGKVAAPGGLTAMQWLLSQPTTGKRSKAKIDADLKAERDW